VTPSATFTNTSTPTATNTATIAPTFTDTPPPAVIPSASPTAFGGG
jgi:hypothetical protein